MSTTTAQLDKSLNTLLAEGYGTITIRVVVVAKHLAPAVAPGDVDEAPVDATPDEVLPDTDKRPVSTFLEEPKRGRQCCVFLINGQRQHAWDNQFIVRDLELKYLRNRMIVVVDCDGLKPEAIAELMQGSRHGFLDGTIYSALESRVIATLKGDPDLRRLEEEAEDEISSLQAGDVVVKAALDQLIEAHHDASAHAHHGHTQQGAESRQDTVIGGLTQSQDVVISGNRGAGADASEPVLALRPDIAVIRLKPNEVRRVSVYPNPESAWTGLESMVVTFDPPLKELQVTRTSRVAGEDVDLKFVQPDDFEEDEYPIDTTLRVLATFKGLPEPRILERRVVINPPTLRPHHPRPPVPLRDDPTVVRVTSRQPIKIVLGGPDVHVRLRWDGKDELVSGNPPAWTFKAICDAPTADPEIFLTRPVDGRFELLIQANPLLKAGEQIRFDVEAIGPGKTLSTAFVADVVEPPSARKVTNKLPGGGQRRPPYELIYVKRENWGDETCWAETWTEDEPGSFEEPGTKTPLYIFVNQDMELLSTYRESLIAKRNAETTIQQRINKYTTHVAFHLYQMYQRKQAEKTERNDDVIEPLSDEQMRAEISRVARTLIKLMEVAG